MTPTEQAKALVKLSEGLRLRSYICPAGYPTIGYGRRIPDLNSPATIDRETAERWFEEDWRAHTPRVSGTEAQLAAMTSFAYNLGVPRLMGSTLLAKHRAGDFLAAAREFLRWTRAGGRVLPGLVKRRTVESNIYLGAP